MNTLERLSDDVFNALPIVTCSIFHYFFFVLGSNNMIVKLLHIRLIIRVCFFKGSAHQYPLVTDLFCTPK